MDGSDEMVAYLYDFLSLSLGSVFILCDNVPGPGNPSGKFSQCNVYSGSKRVTNLRMKCGVTMDNHFLTQQNFNHSMQ